MRRKLVVAALAGGAIACAIALFLVDPSASVFYPPCVFHALTGLACPGCGLTRAAHALLHGDLARALALNALLPLYAALLTPLFVGQLVALWTRRFPRALRVRVSLVGASVVAMLVFGVVRNLPV